MDASEKQIRALKEFGAMAGRMAASIERVLALVRAQKECIGTKKLKINFPAYLADLHALIDHKFKDI